MVHVETGFEGGHGSHWDAAIEDPGLLTSLVRETYRTGTAGPAVDRTFAGNAVKLRPRELPLGGKGFEAKLLEVMESPSAKPAIATMYPHMSQTGKPLLASVKRVIEWGYDALEGEVEVSLESDAGSLIFFATDYWSRAKAYKEGGKHEVALSAVAYTLGVISPEERLEEVEGKMVDVSRAAIIAPLKDNERAPYYDDDFFLQGPVVKVEPFEYPPWDEGAVVRIEVPGVGALPVFGRKKNFPHGWPRLGEFVAAYCWLQGRIAE